MSTFKHSKYTDFANAVKQSLQAFRKAHDVLFIWHSGRFREIASSLRSSQNPVSLYKSVFFSLFAHFPFAFSSPHHLISPSPYSLITHLKLLTLHSSLLPFAFCLLPSFLFLHLSPLPLLTSYFLTLRLLTFDFSSLFTFLFFASLRLWVSAIHFSSNH